MIDREYDNCERKLDEIIRYIDSRLVGKHELVIKLTAALIAGGHVLLEDVPGVGKTTLARSLADSLSCGFTRIQFTPDTMPSDVTGMTIYNMAKGTFETVQGAVMNNIILADEINRTSPKTQASLLEAMQEKQVTIDGKRYDLPDVFMVIATQNPVEHAGTYVLPEAQLDRFMMKLSIGYPDRRSELAMAKKYVEGNLSKDSGPVASEADVINIRKEVDSVTIHESIIGYIADITRKTRETEDIILGASPRATLALIKASQAVAYINGRDYVLPDDVKYIAADVLAHRMIYAPSIAMNGKMEQQFVQGLTGKISVPDGIKNRK